MNGHPSSHANGQPGELHVLLHGTFAFFVNQDGRVEALIPNVKNHVVRAGNWLAETILKPGEYCLEGVDKGTLGNNVLDPERNVILSGVRPTEETPSGDKDALLYARLDLGRPARVSSMLRAKVPKADFTGRDKSKIKVINGTNQVEIATLQVFTYKFSGDAGVLLDKHPWEPAFSGGKTKTINLHIFSATETEHPHGHVSDAFNACLKLFKDAGSNGEVRLKLNLHRPSPATELGDRPAGVVAEEMEDLTPRMRRIALLGRMKKDSRDLTNLWFDNEPLSPDPATCGSPGGNP